MAKHGHDIFLPLISISILFLNTEDSKTVKESACSAGDPGSIPGLGRSLRERNRNPPIFLSGEFHGHRSMVGYRPWGPKEWDRTEWLTLSLSQMITAMNSSFISNLHACCRFVMSDSLQPYGWYPARLLCPWHSPGKNTGVSYHALLPLVLYLNLIPVVSSVLQIFKFIKMSRWKSTAKYERYILDFSSVLELILPKLIRENTCLYNNKT